MPNLMNISLKIYDISGRLVTTLVNDAKAAGAHSVVWNGTDYNNNTVSNGLYIYKLTSEDYNSLSGKMILIK